MSKIFGCDPNEASANLTSHPRLCDRIARYPPAKRIYVGASPTRASRKVRSTAGHPPD